MLQAALQPIEYTASRFHIPEIVSYIKRNKENLGEKLEMHNYKACTMLDHYDMVCNKDVF